MNNTLRKVFRILTVLVGIVATVLTFTDHVLSMGGDGIPTTLYFTTWSVWLALFAAVLVLFMELKNVSEDTKLGRFILLIKFCANIMIIATFIVAAFVLPKKIWTSSYWTLGGTFKHFLLPVLTVVDSILFNPRHTMKVFDPFLGVVIPLLYWVIVIIRNLTFRSANGGMIPEALWDYYYPYSFTNFDNGHSLGGLCGMLAGILVGLILIGFVYFVLDTKLKKKN